MHRRRLLPTAVIAVLATACAAPAAAEVPTPGGTPAPARHDVDCIDHTTSLPAWFVHRAVDHVAGQVESAITGPGGPITFSVRAVDATSYSPDAELATVRLPAIVPAPVPPSPSGNPYLARQERDRSAVYARDRGAWERSLAAARSAAAAAATALRNRPLPLDGRGTDVIGCVLRASSVLGTSGDRRLFIASDLIPAGSQQDSPVPAGLMTGVTVTIAFFCADQASTCRARLEGFSAILTRAGAAAPTVIDPQNLD